RKCFQVNALNPDVISTIPKTLKTLNIKNIQIVEMAFPLSSRNIISGDQECYEDICINKDVFNDIQFTKPVIRSTLISQKFSEFVSLDSTFFPGTFTNIYAVDVDFQKDYSMPCIICWVSKYLNIDIKEQLSNLFEDEFEVMEEIIVPIDTDVNNSNNAKINYSTIMESEEKENDNYYDENGEKNGDGTNGKENNGKDDENGNRDNGGENNENNNNDNGKENHVTSASRVVTKEDSEIFQEFYIVVAICANVIPVNENHKILEMWMGAMLSENSSLHMLDSGYFLDSIVIEVSPVPQQNRTILWKADTQPEQPNRVTKVSTIREKSKGIKGQVNGVGIQMEGNYDEKNAHNTEKIVNEWEMKLVGCFTTGVRWSYFHKDSSYTSNFALGSR
ncbi:30046_t:CDS:2, partial [Gigaspora margarita]